MTVAHLRHSGYLAKIAAIARVRHKCKRIFRFQLIFAISLIVTTIKRFFFTNQFSKSRNICAIYVSESNHYGLGTFLINLSPLYFQFKYTFL